MEHAAFKDVFGLDLTSALGQERYSGIAQRERDVESGLDYVRARMYDPRLGRFTQTDPIRGNRATEHYLYGRNNPARYTDPQGLDVTSDDWNTFNSMMARLHRARAAGNAQFYNRIRADLYSFATKVYKDQGWLELEDQKTALSMVQAVQSIPQMGDLDDDLASEETDSAKGFRGAVSETTGDLETAHTVIKWTDRAATVVGIATCVGGLAQAGRVVLVKSGEAAFKKWLAKEGAKIASGIAISQSGVLDEVEAKVYAMSGMGPEHQEVAAKLIGVLRAIATKKAAKQGAPDPLAEGAHSVFRRDPTTGKVTHYSTYSPNTNPQDPRPWKLTKRIDVVGKPHYNKATGEKVPTPHVHEDGTPGGVRSAMPDELPR